MTDTDEMFEAAGAAPAASSLAEIEKLAAHVVGQIKQAEELEEVLKQLKSEINDIKHSRLPDMMASAGLQSITTSGGAVIKIDDFCSGSLPKDPTKREEALQWLVEHDGEGLIKTNVDLVFGRGDHDLALEIAEELKARKLEVTVESGVHPMSLQSYARERIKSGDDIDPQKLGLFVGRVAKIKV